MVEASKLWFESTCSGFECRDLIHPWTSTCSDATATMLISCIKGSYKFYAMVYLIQILMRGKKLGKKEIIEQLKLYLKSGIFGLTVGSSFVTLNCIFRARPDYLNSANDANRAYRNQYGTNNFFFVPCWFRLALLASCSLLGKLFFSKFSYYTTVLLPCTVSGLAVYFEPPYRRVMVVNLFVNLVFEYWLRTLEMKGWLRRSPGKETLIFMLGSAVFFYLLRRDRENERRTPIFWFFTPPRVSKEVGEPVDGIEGRSVACPHKGTCKQYIFKGTAQLFGVGCAMTMLRTIIPKILTPGKALRSLRFSHLKLGIFFGGYIGIYRLVVCLLCRAHGRDAAWFAAPAGFLSGAAFRAAPSTPIALAPLTSALQILASWGCQKGMIPSNWPLVEILYCLCQGLLFHARVMHEDVCPRYIINLMHTVTQNKADEIQAAFIEKMLKSK